MTKTEKQKLFTETALAQIDLIDAEDLTTRKDRIRTEWCALHGLVELFNLGAEYINWQFETFGAGLFNIGRDKTGYYDDNWVIAGDWYIKIREERAKANLQALAENNVTVNDEQMDQEYYMGG